ncbi:hypothetical protein [Parvularcula marina]|uniref:hypothetical protein n=1 Tax=Parvularcula marina TaxID=2292771 RepID=UPI0035143B4C
MNSIRTEFVRIGVVAAILFTLALWQRDFIVSAIQSNVPLNLTIIGTFAFGLSLVGMALYALRNEFLALYALKEAHEDAERELRNPDADPMWRFERAHSPAIVFKRPRILGQAYDLISEQLARDHTLTINTATMQTLMEGIDDRLGERRGLITYVSGILVFLGLIGTFIGLMVTLASVGDILGGLDLDSADPAATVSALMANLQTPLGGMATGFSSSLFGLVTSLTISIMSQLVGRASGNLKSDFSRWLSTIVELQENPAGGSSKAAAQHSAAIEEKRLALLMRTARYVVNSSQRQNRTLNTSLEVLRKLTEENREQKKEIAQLVHVARVLTRQQIHTTRAMQQSSEAISSLARATDLKDEVHKVSTIFSSDLQERDMLLHDTLESLRLEIAAKTSAQGQITYRDDSEAEYLSNALAEDSVQYDVSRLQKLVRTIYSMEQSAGASADDETNEPRIAKEA